MNITNKTILITGGGSGIGFETAKLLVAKGNKVIITGRTESRLKEAAAKIPGLNYLAADITSEDSVKQLVEHVNAEFGGLNILINNAGQAYAYAPGINAGAFQKASDEILTNYLAVIRLTEAFLPSLQKQAEAAVVNVTSVLAIVPNTFISTYAASKAALHSYTLSLRLALSKDTAIKVFELMPPLVDTDFSKDIGGHNGIHPSEVAAGLIAGLEQEQYELHIGRTADVYKLYLSSPEEALKAVNQ